MIDFTLFAQEAEAGMMVFMVVCWGLVMVINLVGFAFWIWMLIDVVQNEKQGQHNELLIWLLVVILAGWIGGLIYYFVRRRPRLQRASQPQTYQSPPGGYGPPQS